MPFQNLIYVSGLLLSVACFAGDPVPAPAPTPSFAGAAATEAAALKLDAATKAGSWAEKAKQLEEKAKKDSAYVDEAKQAALLRDIYAKQATEADAAVNKNGILDKTNAYGEYLESGKINSKYSGQSATVNIPEGRRADYAAAASDGTATAAEMQGVTTTINNQNYAYGGIANVDGELVHSFTLQNRSALHQGAPDSVIYRGTPTPNEPENIQNPPLTVNQNGFYSYAQPTRSPLSTIVEVIRLMPPVIDDKK